MSELSRPTVDFLVRTKRWPLLILSLISAAFWFSKEYFGLTFRDTCDNWLFLCLVALLTLVTGVLYIVASPKRVEGWIIGVILGTAGLTLGVIGQWRHQPSPLPEDSLVVLVTEFTAITPSAEDEARNVSDRIEQELIAKQRAGAPIKVRRATKPISGSDDQAKEDLAIALGRSHELSSHVVIWGEVREDHDEISIRPHITLAQPVKGAPLQFSNVSALTFLEPRTLQLNKEFAGNIADIVSLAYALAFFKIEQWDRALPILKEVSSPVGRLYEGLCEIQRSRGSSNPISNWDAAIADFDKILGRDSADPSAESDSLTWDAYLNTANATLLVASSSRPEDSLPLIQKAAHSYTHALENTEMFGSPEKKAVLYLDLAVALRHESLQTTGPSSSELTKQATSYLQQALASSPRDASPFMWAAAQYDISVIYGAQPSTLQEALEANTFAAQVFTKEKYPWLWASTKNNSGNILKEIGTRTSGDSGIRLLTQALGEFEETCSVFTKEKFPSDWAGAENNLGAVLITLGERSDAKDGLSFLQRAESSLLLALEVRTKSRLPLDWAITMTNLGAVQEALGKRNPGAVGVELFTKSVDAYRGALEVQTQAHDPLDWANTEFNLGNVLRSLGHRLGVHGGLPVLTASIDSFDRSASVRTRDAFPEAWLQTQNSIGTVQCEIGDWILGHEGDQAIKKAINVYEEALAADTSRQFPEIRIMLLTNLGLAQGDLGTRPSAATSTDLLRQSIGTYQTALAGYDFSESPKAWANLKNNIGIVQRILGKRLNNEEGRDLIRNAVDSERDALRFRTEEISPEDRAKTEENLGNALSDLGMRTGGAQGKKMLTEAISCFDEALFQYRNPGFETELNRVSFEKIMTSGMLTLFHMIPPSRSPK